VIFNENEVFQEDLERLKDQLRKTSLEEIRKILQKAMTEIPRDRFKEEEGA
jgi:predicted unusual protein kinase regulating ubiquinone biosynthesis (AarF/ABC1/UbiB family)